MTGDKTAERPLRADAVRTRRALLAAAADVFAELGIDASVAQVAARAGIGKGTVFGHFPTKEALLTAIVTDAVDDLVAATSALPGDLTPDAALLALMKLQVDRYASNRAFIELLNTSRAAQLPDVQAQVTRLIEAGRPIVDRAHREGSLDEELDARDVVLLACGLFGAAEPLLAHEPRAADRYLRVAFRGMTRGD
ncbi:TetR/AcrR family transcriptional regulator [Lentzea sp. JNUCC 0626]|uniref:TetR/AcrR family transcriptional regulator n=1 Tax=Lentzea sp. JNUCC 0626 TaxID=3367513 RepID=UPI0037480CFD